MKLYISAIVAAMMLFGAQSLIAFQGNWSTDTIGNEQEALTALKEILPSVNNGTNKKAMSIADSRCKKYSNVKFGNAQAELKKRFEEKNGQVMEVYYAAIRFNVDCTMKDDLD